MEPTQPVGPQAANTNDPQARYWRELYDLVIRGLSDPESLDPDEVMRISRVALLGLKRIGTQWGDPPKPPAPERNPG